MTWFDISQKSADKLFKKRALVLFVLSLVVIALFSAVYRLVFVFEAQQSADNGDRIVIIETPAVQGTQITQEPEPPVQAAYAVMVNGAPCAVLDSEQNAQRILDRILNEYRDLAAETFRAIEQAEFLEHVTIQPVAGEPHSQILSLEEAYHALTAGEFAPKVKITAADSQTEEIKSNPKPEQSNDEALPENTRLIVSYGRSGLKSTQSKVILVNNEEVLRKDFKDTVLIEQERFMIRQGTAKLSGKSRFKKGKDESGLLFAAPVKGSVKLAFGPRKASMHYGLDYECKNSLNVSAAESGKVAAVMERGGYGKMIEIDHGNSFVTRYANLKQTGVQVGEWINKGDMIAEAGGGEGAQILHFEIRIDGCAYDPKFYIAK